MNKKSHFYLNILNAGEYGIVQSSKKMNITKTKKANPGIIEIIEFSSLNELKRYLKDNYYRNNENVYYTKFN